MFEGVSRDVWRQLRALRASAAYRDEAEELRREGDSENEFALSWKPLDVLSDEVRRLPLDFVPGSPHVTWCQQASAP